MAVLLHGIIVGHFTKAFGHKFVVLGAEDYGVHLHGLMGFTAVLNCELALGIRPQIGHQLRFIVTDIGQYFKDFVAKVERKGHIVFRVTACVTEHHALVSGALVFTVLAFNAAVDVRALLMEGAEDATAGGVEHVFGLGVAYSADCVTDGGLDVYIGLGLNFTHHYHHSGGTEGLAGNFCLRVLHQKLVKDGVRYLVRHFVGVSFRHALRREEVIL